MTPQPAKQDTLDRPRSVMLSVVIPAYNEESRLAETLQQTLDYLKSLGAPVEIIVVDDGSTDATATIAEGFAAAHSSLSVIRNDHRGKAFTVRTGILSATGRYVLFTDADGATPISECERLLDALRAGADVAIGSREGSGASREGEPWYRHIMGRVFNVIVQALAVPGIRDTQCGFKAFRRDAARDLFSHMLLYGPGSGPIRGALLTGFDVEILFMARKWGYVIREVPVLWRYGTRSKVSPLKDSWRNLRDVLRVRYNDLMGRYQRA